ncbi:MAG: hypothetical protein OXT63_06205 [Gemmatimonadota bacterium]|nr:hypothetical protein [Gemmatimonadota bacterium]
MPDTCDSCHEAPGVHEDADTGFVSCEACHEAREDHREEEPCECCEDAAVVVRYDCLNTRYAFCAEHGYEDAYDEGGCPEARERCSCFVKGDTLVEARVRAAFVGVARENLEETGEEEDAAWLLDCRTVPVVELLVVAGFRGPDTVPAHDDLLLALRRNEV